MKNDNLKLGFLVILFLPSLLILQSCVFAPGMDMRKTLRKGDGLVYAPVNGIEQQIPIIQINDTLINELSSNEDHLVVPNEFIEENQRQAYRVGVNDVLLVVVWGQEELMQGTNANNPMIQRNVREDGTFYFPYAGLVMALGKTREEIRIDLTKKLSTYFRDPQVDVSIQEYNSKQVVLTGQFRKPITIPITSVPLTLSKAISSAGGPTQQADLTDLQIKRGNVLHHLNYHKLANQGLIHNIVLKDGDVLNLPVNQSNSAYVVGEVGRPLKLDLWTGRITLTDALASARGISSSTGSGNEVFVVRGVDTIAGEKAIYRLNAKSPASYLLASRFEVRPQDVIFVGPSELTKWNRVISQIFPFARFLNVADDLDIAN